MSSLWRSKRPILAQLLATIVLGGGLVVLAFLPALAVADEVVEVARGTLQQVGRLPDIDRPPERSQMLASDGSSIGWFVGEQNRVVVPLERMPKTVRQAVIATEDREFFSHQGVDQQAILRALVTNVRSGRIEEGASTITQQYVRAALLSSEVTLGRKVTEAVYAVRLEKRASKKQILEGYLNRVYFGHGAYGVAAAAERYFGRPLGRINLAEAAMLAGMVRNPAGNNPLSHPEAAIRRRNIVLDQMAAADFISPQQARQAKQVEYDKKQAQLPQKMVYPFFTAYVKEQLLQAEKLGDTRAERSRALYEDGLRIHTTVSRDLQDTARQVIRGRLEEPRTDPMGGIVSLEPGTGRVRAMAVGPKRWGHCSRPPTQCSTTTVNPLVPGVGSPGRQAGSAFKPFTAAAALENGIGTSFHASTHQQPIEGCSSGDGLWSPANYSGSGHGTVDMVAGTRDSINVFYAQLIAEVGPAKVAAMAEKLGITPDIPAFCSIALGTADVYALDMAEAFATFANGGRRCDPMGVTKVTDSTGKVILNTKPKCERVISQRTAATLTSLLRNVVQSGTGTAAAIGRPVAGKTGTTQDYRDAWFVGFAPQLATAVWLGYEQPRPMRGILGYGVIAGGTVPAQTWAEFMSAALEGVPVKALAGTDLERYVPPPPPEPEGEADAEASGDPSEEQTQQTGQQQTSRPGGDGGEQDQGQDGSGDQDQGSGQQEDADGPGGGGGGGQGAGD